MIVHCAHDPCGTNLRIIGARLIVAQAALDASNVVIKLAQPVIVDVDRAVEQASKIPIELHSDQVFPMSLTVRRARAQTCGVSKLGYRS